MRELTEVIDQMLEAIPSEEIDLRSELEDLRGSAIVSAPELMQLRWQMTAEALADHLGDQLHSEGWKKQIQDIWMDR